MSPNDPKPAKRGPGRPRKNPLPPPQVEKIVEVPATEPEPSSDLDWPQLIYEVVVEAEPVTLSEVSELTGFDVPRITEILDGLVSAERLILGDDGLYRIDVDRTDDQYRDIIGPEVTIEGEYDDTPQAAHTVVYLPSSDIVAFLRNINLPPHLTAGFGIPSEVHGFIDFEDAVPAEGEMQASGAFRVVLYGKHLNAQPRLNPNQPGYESQIQRSFLSPDPDAAVEP